MAGIDGHTSASVVHPPMAPLDPADRCTIETASVLDMTPRKKAPCLSEMNFHQTNDEIEDLDDTISGTSPRHATRDSTGP